MTTIAERIRAGEIHAPDVLVGGTPCQSFSVAGMRGGMADARGALTISYVELANEIDRTRIAAGNEPCIIVWENVPGVLSSKDNAFGCFLGALSGETDALQPPGGKWKNAGYVSGPQRTIAWRILDAQYFGVAQRRRRVFVIASARDGFDPAEILFEFEGLRRDTAPSREKGQSSAADVAPSLTASGRGVERIGETRGQDPVITQRLTTGTGQRYDPEMETILPVAFPWQAGGSMSMPYDVDLCGTLIKNQTQAVALALRGRDDGATAEFGDEVGRSSGSETQSAHRTYVVRRLTVEECEFLQGFPRGYTLVPVRNKPAADGPRYKALGNSMCVNVMAWIGRRLDCVMTKQPANDNQLAA